MRHFNMIVTPMLSAIFLVLAGCASGPKPIAPPEISAPPDGASEQMLWSSERERPAWINRVPPTANGVLSFVGYSVTHAAERDARNDALRDVTDGIVRYMGTLVMNKHEEARVTFGLVSDVANPTVGVNAYQQQLSTNIASFVKLSDTYMEKWQTPTGIGYRGFVLAAVTDQDLRNADRRTATDMMRRAEQRAREENNVVAKKQMEDSAQFWRMMREQGVME